MDDVVIEQRHLTKAQAGGSHTLLSETFETATRPPKPLAYGAHVAVRTSTASGTVPPHDLHSAEAARKGSVGGAKVEVPPRPEASTEKVLLSLGKFHAVAGTLRLGVWARATAKEAAIGLEVLDESDGFKWLGSAALKPVGNAWKKLSLEVPSTALQIPQHARAL